MPAYGSEWYARWMYKEGDAINEYHKKTYGPTTEFGYKDFVPMFKAANFDPNAWAEVFKASGAGYVVPVAEHHDGFSMYNSSFNEWNSVKMGPKRDIMGELKTAITAQGLHFGLSSHRCENAWFFEYGMETPSDVQDRSITMYGERLKESEFQGMDHRDGKHICNNENSRREWLMHTYELIDQYQPELIFFDWTVGKDSFVPTFYKFMAYYYNTARDWNKEVVVNTKFGFGDNIQVFDIERGKSDRIREHAWQTDTSIGKKSWSYTPDEENKTPNHIIDDFVDIVSKNGNLLLNIGPKEDGTITDEQKSVLLELGKWLEVNGEAIYSSRPWVVASQGSKGTSGYMTDSAESHYTADDMRFTTRDNNLYVTTLAWKEGSILVEALAKEFTSGVEIEGVEMLGSSEKIDYKLSDKGLELTFPEVQPTDYAHVFKIKLSGEVHSTPIVDVVGDGVVAEVRFANHSSEDGGVVIESKAGKSQISERVTIPAKSLILKKFSHEDAGAKAEYSFVAEY